MSDGHELGEETFALLELARGYVVVLNEVDYGPKQLHVSEPLGLKVNIL